MFGLVPGRNDARSFPCGWSEANRGIEVGACGKLSEKMQLGKAFCNACATGPKIRVVPVISTTSAKADGDVACTSIRGENFPKASRSAVRVLRSSGSERRSKLRPSKGDSSARVMP